MTENTTPSASLARYSKLATDPLRNFRFYVEWTAADGDSNSNIKFASGFTQIQGLSINTQSIGYREGGMNTTLHQIPGMTTFSPITLQRGAVYTNTTAINWMKMLFAAASGEGVAATTTSNFRVNLNIYVLDHPVSTTVSGNDNISASSFKMKFTVHNAWITNLSYNDLNASDNQLLFETIQLVHEGLSINQIDSNGNNLA